jgi:catechol 2,3-dioxygenase-like lactoylglutathione lyase family enzyme
MKLGAFCISLAVRDLERSRAFYAALGFEVTGGNAEQNWLVMRNPDAICIGLFQGMFERNILTFNPGWGPNRAPLESFTDVRQLQAVLKDRGLTPNPEVESDSGPGHFMLTDPDGNPVLIDQHR